MKLEKHRFAEVTINHDKKRVPLSSMQRAKRQGKYRYYGAQGVIDYVDDYIFDGTYLLIAEDGENLKSKKQNIAQIVEGKFWVNNHAHIIQGTELCDIRYLCYLINSMDLSAYVTGSAQPKLSQANLNSVMLNLPSIEEQRKIVEYLYMFDCKIETNKKINNNLEQQARAIYQNMFEDIDSLPAGWRKVSLGEVVNISNKSFNPLKEPETLLEHYSIPAYDDAKFPVFELSSEIKSNKFVIDDSCFMISKLNPTTKRVWRPYCLTNNAVCSTEFIVYKAKEESMTDYLYSVINSDSFSEFMCSHVTGSTGSRQRTTPKDTLFFEVIIPTEEELSTFQSTVAPMYAQMHNIAIENSKLKETRDALLPKLMSGEIDVSNI